MTAAGTRAYADRWTSSAEDSSNPKDDERIPEQARRRRDPKTGRRSSELEDLSRAKKAMSGENSQDPQQQRFRVIRQPTRATAPGARGATMTPGYVGARRNNNEL